MPLSTLRKRVYWRVVAISSALLLHSISSFSIIYPHASVSASHCTIAKQFPLYLHRAEADLDIVFGSSNASGISWGEEEEDLYVRSDRVAELLHASDQEYRDQRRQQKWGSFANVTKKEDLVEVLNEERQKILKEHESKAAIAELNGVTYQVLEPKEVDDRSFFDESGNIKISSGSAKGWFADMDDDLAEEWKSLTAGDDSAAAQDVQFEEATGKIVARDSLAGVRVGSAGGWTLEVFPGDFVVHRKYGIGRFERTCLRPKTKLTKEEQAARDERRAEILTTELKALQSQGIEVTPETIKQIRSRFGTEEDLDIISNPQTTVLEISYLDSIVHVPVDRAYRLSRYRAGNAVIKPKLSRVKGEAWSKAKRRVEENTIELAQDVLALYATRETLFRPPFDPEKEEKVKKMEATFAFTPTPDQIKCFEDVENDMIWRSRPMDRLVCGDVGFGKTEIALRALYRAIVNGRQSALLAPTGVLASQHYKNILKRMGPDTEFGVSVTLLRGGTSKNTKIGKEIREDIASGKIQLIVGTHALISNDVTFKDLGLLVVDEEQRFGVKQKERLKLICNGIDVLTLSATPIPRTLQMSLSGIRDTSTLRSPPPMRKPTITYVQEYSEDLVQLAIETELQRGGQVYYVVPRIAMLQDAEDTIKRLLPDVRVIQAHGRMQRNGAEENVAEFAEGAYDVLLATTVIENGVDIPTVNTIVIQNSQAFGMSTLYQLRGRVGRSDQQAYAYFLHREESITEQASMRLQAIGELNELGSGFDVANRDLEIRGAGSLLGTEQSGMAAKVGFDLYMRMLKKSIRKLRGLDLPVVPRTNILLPVYGTPDTFTIPEDFIPNREQAFKEASEARLAENTAQLVTLTNKWKDKYGALPADLQNQLKTMHLHACCRRLGIDLVGLVDYDDHADCVLRSPGLRPRHLTTIASLLPNGVLPKGLDVCFPARFSHHGDDFEIRGGSKLDIKQLKADNSLSEDQEEEEWDSLDAEEIEAMKDISSAVNVKHMDEVDVEMYPRFVVHDFGNPDKAVDRLLKLLLPVAKVVFAKQRDQAEEAKLATELRDRQELLRTRKKQNEASETQRYI